MAQAPSPAGAIRNVAIVGHSGSGKTTLAQALLGSGAPLRSGEGSPPRTVSLAFSSLQHRSTKINLLDTPGYADFVGDLRAGLRAADAALFVISATDGVDVATQLLWEECAAVGMPRAIVVTKIDSPRADFAEAVAVCQRVFGEGVHPLLLPVHEGNSQEPGAPAALYDLLSEVILDHTSTPPSAEPADPEHRELVAGERAELLEAIIAESEDETLMDRYLAGDELDIDTLTKDFETAVARGNFYPVLPVCSPTGLGTIELLDLLVAGFPSPLEHPLPVITTTDGSPIDALTCDPAGPLCAEIVKTSSDNFVGRVSLVRVFSGTLALDQPVHVSGHFSGWQSDGGHEDHDLDERVGGLAAGVAKGDATLPSAGAGDICAVLKLTKAETGDTLSAVDRPLLMAAWEVPEPLLAIALEPSKKTDEDKLAQGLARLVAEDPTLRVERNHETHQLLLWCLGESHADVVLERLKTRFQVEVTHIPVRIPLRETFATAGKGHGRHVKQSGGHGQFAVCDIVVEPLDSGAGFEFVDKVVGGAIPGTFIGSIEKGVRQQMERGVIAGYPVVDLRVTVVDGKAHSVDSSDMAFQTAGALALKEAAATAEVSLLEPVLELEIRVADGYVGPVMSDLSGRRGRVIGSEPLADRAGFTAIRAEVPETEIARYPIDLRGLSHGTATFSRRYLRHEPIPSHLKDKLVSGT